MSKQRIFIIVFLVIVGLWACSTSSSDLNQENQSQQESVTASGEVQCEYEYCDSGTVTLVFNPGGGPVNGEGELIDGNLVTKLSFQGKVYENNELKGAMDWIGEASNFSLSWTAEYSDGIVEGVIYIYTDDSSPAYPLQFTLSY